MPPRRTGAARSSPTSSSPFSTRRATARTPTPPRFRRPSCASRSTCEPAQDPAARSGRRREELERDAVGVAEAHTRAVVRVLDLSVRDIQSVEAVHPLLQLGAVATPETDVVEA